MVALRATCNCLYSMYKIEYEQRIDYNRYIILEQCRQPKDLLN